MYNTVNTNPIPPPPTKKLKIASVLPNTNKKQSLPKIPTAPPPPTVTPTQPNVNYAIAQTGPQLTNATLSGTVVTPPQTGGGIVNAATNFVKGFFGYGGSSTPAPVNQPIPQKPPTPPLVQNTTTPPTTPLPKPLTPPPVSNTIPVPQTPYQTPAVNYQVTPPNAPQFQTPAVTTPTVTFESIFNEYSNNRYTYTRDQWDQLEDDATNVADEKDFETLSTLIDAGRTYAIIKQKITDYKPGNDFGDILKKINSEKLDADGGLRQDLLIKLKDATGKNIDIDTGEIIEPPVDNSQIEEIQKDIDNLSSSTSDTMLIDALIDYVQNDEQKNKLIEYKTKKLSELQQMEKEVAEKARLQKEEAERQRLEEEKKRDEEREAAKKKTPVLTIPEYSGTKQNLLVALQNNLKNWDKDELDKHYLPELEEAYKEGKLSEENYKRIKTLTDKLQYVHKKQDEFEKRKNDMWTEDEVTNAWKEIDTTIPKDGSNDNKDLRVLLVKSLEGNSHSVITPKGFYSWTAGRPTKPINIVDADELDLDDLDDVDTSNIKQGYNQQEVEKQYEKTVQNPDEIDTTIPVESDDNDKLQNDLQQSIDEQRRKEEEERRLAEEEMERLQKEEAEKKRLEEVKKQLEEEKRVQEMKKKMEEEELRKKIEEEQKQKLLEEEARKRIEQQTALDLAYEKYKTESPKKKSIKELKEMTEEITKLEGYDTFDTTKKEELKTMYKTQVETIYRVQVDRYKQKINNATTLQDLQNLKSEVENKKKNQYKQEILQAIEEKEKSFAVVQPNNITYEELNSEIDKATTPDELLELIDNKILNNKVDTITQEQYDQLYKIANVKKNKYIDQLTGSSNPKISVTQSTDMNTYDGLTSAINNATTVAELKNLGPNINKFITTINPKYSNEQKIKLKENENNKYTQLVNAEKEQRSNETVTKLLAKNPLDPKNSGLPPILAPGGKTVYISDPKSQVSPPKQRPTSASGNKPITKALEWDKKIDQLLRDKEVTDLNKDWFGTANTKEEVDDMITFLQNRYEMPKYKNIWPTYISKRGDIYSKAATRKSQLRNTNKKQ